MDKIPDDLLMEVVVAVGGPRDLIYVPFGDGEQTILVWVEERWPLVSKRWCQLHEKLRERRAR
jgi:hypothetical protein